MTAPRKNKKKGREEKIPAFFFVVSKIFHIFADNNV